MRDPDTTVARLRRARQESKAKQSDNKSNGGAGLRMLPSPKQPLEVAKVFLTEFMDDSGLLMLRFWRGDWMRWRISHWRRQDARAVRRILYRFLDRAGYVSEKGEILPWSPTRHKVADVLDALEAVALLDRDVEQPAWLADDDDVIDERETGSIVACANCLLDVVSGKCFPHTPRFFNLVAVPFAYDAEAAEPERWLNFLGSLWPTPAAQPGGPAVPEIAPEVDALGEWFGYVLSGWRDLHKMFLMVGPTRGGKGVIARILTALIGKANTASPTIDSLSGQFGLAPLIGKPLATISDARLTSSSNVVERLLTISGGDMLTIDIKYHEQWTGFLPTRLHLVSNELPRFADASSAIVGRFVIVLTQQSWFGREDKGLEAEIRKELPGIFNWALAGLHRLAASDWRFTEVPSAAEALATMHDIASPLRAFVRECCYLGPDKSVARQLLYDEYKIWAIANGYRVTNNAIFGRDLHTAFPTEIRDERPRDESGGRTRIYGGIALKPRAYNDDGGGGGPDAART